MNPVTAVWLGFVGGTLVGEAIINFALRRHIGVAVFLSLVGLVVASLGVVSARVSFRRGLTK